MSAVRRGTFVALLAATFMMAGAGSALAAFGAVNMSRLSAPDYQYYADVSGDRIAYLNAVDEDTSDVWVYDIGTKARTRLTSDAAPQLDLEIDGTRIIWETLKPTGIELSVRDLASSAATVVALSEELDSDAVSGSRVAWSDGQIHLYDATTGENELLASKASTYQGSVSISGDLVSWIEESETSGEQTVWVHDLSTHTSTKISTLPAGYFAGTTAIAKATADTDPWVAWERIDQNDNTVVFYKNLKSNATGSKAVTGRIESLVLDRRFLGWVEVGLDSPTAVTKVALLDAADGRFYRAAADTFNVSLSGERVVWTNIYDIFLGRLDTSTPTFSRFYGPSRFDTAIELSKDAYPSGADTVVIATGYGYADALSAAPLASAYDAPMLLSRRDFLGTALTDELKRLAPNKIFIAGGAGAVSDAVKAQLASLPSTPTVTRLAGSSRYSTSAAIARQVKDKLGKTTKVVVCNGENWSDALAVAPVAATNGWPILLTKAGIVPPAISSAMSYLKPTSTLVVGTTGSVSNTVKSKFVSSSRVYGTSGPATSVAVAKWAASNGGVKPVRIGLATSAMYPDALAAGPFLALKRNNAGLILLVPPTGLPSVTADYLKANRFSVKKVQTMGGPTALPESIVSKVRSIVR